MKTAKFTKELAQQVKKLPTMSEQITSVTSKTVPGVYTFRNCPNVAIWNINKVTTGTKDKTEVEFDFCLRSFEVKTGGEYYANAFSRNLRKLTDSGNKTSKGKPGPDTASERERYGAYANEDVIAANTDPKKA